MQDLREELLTLYKETQKDIDYPPIPEQVLEDSLGLVECLEYKKFSLKDIEIYATPNGGIQFHWNRHWYDYSISISVEDWNSRGIVIFHPNRKDKHGGVMLDFSYEEAVLTLLKAMWFETKWWNFVKIFRPKKKEVS